MVIDTHIHVFDEKIAHSAVEKLKQTAQIENVTDGTVADTDRKMTQWGVDKGVLLSIATKPSQQRKINDWIASKASERFIPFGPVHPDAPDAVEELEDIKELGMKGIKLHPDYQNFLIDEKRMYPIYERCRELGLICIFHGGYDPVSPELVHAMPEQTAKVLKELPGFQAVIAHLGGFGQWDDVEEYLAGTDCYLDTALLAHGIENRQYERIIQKHGADKILFATDCPWESACDAINKIEQLSISDDDKEKIFYRNAALLLRL